MKRAFFVGLLLLFVASASADEMKEAELEMQILMHKKALALSDQWRAELLNDNAHLRLRSLIAEEARLKEKIAGLKRAKAEKEKTE